MREHQDTLGVEPVLRELHIPTSTFEHWRHRAEHPSKRELRDGELVEEIRRIHRDSNGTYGSPRVYAMLRREGQAVSLKRVERLMREHSITGVAPARKVRTTVRNPADALSDDLVKRDFTAAGPDRLWVTDLTLISTGEGPLWLASIRDAFSRRVVAWETSRTADANLVCAVLEYALHSRRPRQDRTLIHHADHGCQYTSIKLTTRLLKAGIKPSMGTVGDSFDNALAENMWSTIKTECVRRQDFATRAEAEMALFQYLDGFYNTTRIQRGLGWRSPDEFETAHHAGQLTDADYTRLADLAQRRKARRDRDRESRRSPATPPTHAATPAHEEPAPTPSPKRHRRPGQRPAGFPTTQAGTAERVRPSGRTPTEPQKNRSTG